MADIVSQSSLSYDSVKNNLIGYVQSLNDYNTRFKDFWEGGPGVTLIELMAGLGTYLNLIALKSRREAYIDEARLTSSVTNIATTLGYNINRKACPQYTISILCITGVTWLKETIIGYYNGLPLSLIEDTTFIPGSNTVTVVIGTWKQFTATSSSANFYSRYLIEDEVDNNIYNLIVNGSEVKTVIAAEDLANNSDVVLIRSYFGGTYLIFGDGIFGRQLQVNDQVTFEYIVPGAIASDAVFLTSKFTSNLGSIESGNVLYYGSDQDSNEKLAAVAPGYYTTKRRLVTYSDYKYIALSYQGIISASVQKYPGICCTMNVCMMAANGRVLTDTEKTSFLSYMNDHQVLGTNILLVDPVAITVNAKFIIVVTSTADQTAISTVINNYLNTMTYKLGQFFTISGVLNLALAGVIGIYPQYPITDNQAAYNQYFVLSGVTITYTTSVTSINSFGADPTLGYS